MPSNEVSIPAGRRAWNQTSQDGLSLYFQSWEPTGPAGGLVCLVHGLGEHSDRYAHVARFLNQAGFVVVTLDLRGHGRSGGPRGHVPSYEAYCADIDLLLRTACERFPGVPVFLYGHSMGAQLVLYYTLQRKPALAGVVATSPGFRNALQEQALKVGLVRILGKVLPRQALATGLDPNAISRDRTVVDAYVQDPLVHDKTTLGWGRHTLESLAWMRVHAAEFPCPLLLMHGTGDALTYYQGSQEFAAQAPGVCTLKLWEGLYHEIHNEPEKEQVLAFMVNWMNEVRQAGHSLDKLAPSWENSPGKGT